eukprot:TRINITY_DN13142_c1_g1_i2.p1 TRINITY_DN13142_c1_g1~~TRINITY_DN13142_c1_g1_i2.p1  ORF type:complete len:734 (+),score=98.06 TRINITY_DN13142_c1_g1_i2:225-2426(+)
MGQTSTKAGVVVWGSSDHGQLGIGSLTAEDRALPPRLVEGLRSVHVRHVVCSGHYSVAVSESGEVYTWGCGKDGQLGHGDAKDVYAPKAVRSLQSKLIRSVSCAEHHIAAVSENGVLYTWGRGQHGRLGHGGTENEHFPKVTDSLVGQHVVSVSCGDFHTACVTLTQVYTFGLGLSGRLGHGHEKDCLVPTPVDALSAVPIAYVACGGHHSAIIVENTAHLMTWGGGAFGKLGHGNRLAQTTPKKVAALQSKRVVQVSLGPHHSAILSQKGEVFTWGQAGRLGHASQSAEADEMVPRQVMALSNVFVLQVSCGHSHCAVVTETGDVWAWGSSRTFGHTEPHAVPNVPTLIRVLNGKAIVQVACGVTHSIALSDYRRLSGKAAMAAVRSMGAGSTAAAGKDRSFLQGSITAGGRHGDVSQDQLGDAKKPERFLDVSGGEGTSLGHLRSTAGGGSDDRSGTHGGLIHGGERPSEGGEGHGGGQEGNFKSTGLPPPSMEMEVAYLSSELKTYQEQTLRLAKLLQEAKVKLETLQNENSFLKSELEVMHQCSNDADERLDTLRRHFNERIREMERRYGEKERAWKDTFHRLRSHLEVGAMDVDTRLGLGGLGSIGGLGGIGGLGARGGLGGLGGLGGITSLSGLGGIGGLGGLGAHEHAASNRGSDALSNPALGGDVAAHAEGGSIGLAGEEQPVGLGSSDTPAGSEATGRGGEAQAWAPERGRMGGRTARWPSGQS